MANRLTTIFQNLDRAIVGNWETQTPKHVNQYDMSGNHVIATAHDKESYAKKKLELQQNAYLGNMWRKANVDMTIQAFTGLNNIKLMYRDAELMDAFPEIGTALDIIAEEATVLSSKGEVVNVYSKSERVKSILEDLFTNRLNLHITAPMIIRAMCKYGNQFMLMNIDHKMGIMGWRQLPVYNIERLENGIENPYSAQGFINAPSDTKKRDMSTKFVWLDAQNSSQVEFREWQIGHFRLLTDSLYLPYGSSYLNKARRHWRMLSLMEDMMLIYRLERSIERRVYKIYVGAIDEADVPAYVEEIANNFKRTPIIDPMTGQLDLRKNILPVRRNTPIPLLDGRIITIEDLAKEYESGKTNYVYSVQDRTHQIVPGKVVWCGKNYTADKLYRITLNDDTYLDLAGEHELIMRDGTKKRADEVSVGESVMPFYRQVDKNSEKLFDGYEKVYNPHSSKYEFTHRMIAECVEKGDDNFNTIHHKDFNRYNNEPNNLLWCDYAVEVTNNEELEYISENLNECVIKGIEIVEGDDVYCMTVVGLNNEDDRHNFALCTYETNGSVCENGMFVSNCVDQDIFLPVRDPNASTPIDTLSGAQNLTAMDDIKFVQQKVLTALAIPSSFLNFEDAQGEGKNLALMDIRFTRRINRIQQAFLMELTKIASIHLYLLGFEDELTNFSLSMNNPSTQAEQLQIENIEKKITAVRDAVADPGTGIPIMSTTRALKEILKWSDKDIQENFEELRLEKALASELEKTTQIIKKTGIFDVVDNIYGEPGAEYQDGQEQGQEGDMGGGPMGGDMGGPPMGGDLDMGGDDIDALGMEGAPEDGEISGAEGEIPMGDAPSDEPPMESVNKKKPLLTESKKIDDFSKRNQIEMKRAKIYDDAFLINEEFDDMIKSLGDFLKD